MTKKTKVMMILLDGAPFNVFYSLAQKGILPNMQKLMNIGCFNLLKSTIPSTSPVAIPSLFTGRNPGKHGIFDWCYMENGILRPYTSKNIMIETIWDVLNTVNKKVILLNIPLTYPPLKVNGIMVSGPPTPRNRVESYPPEIISIIESKIGQYYVDLNIIGFNYMGNDEEAFLEEAYLVTQKRTQATQYLMENYDWDLFIAGFTTLDRIQHVFFGYFQEESPFFNLEKKNVLIKYYKQIDNSIGKIVSLLDENTILFIVSDHGFDYLNKYVGINNLLFKNSLIKKRKRFRLFTIENFIGFCKIIGIGNIEQKLSKRIHNLAIKILPRKTNFNESHCFAISGQSILINKKYFDDLNNMRLFKNKIKKYLLSIEDIETGEKIIENVYDKHKIYSGNEVTKAPDLILCFKRGYEARVWTKNTFEPVKIIKNKTVKTGTHNSSYAQKGIFVASGPGIKEGFHLEANIIDIVPTILHIMGIPVSHDMDGQVLNQIFNQNRN